MNLNVESLEPALQELLVPDALIPELARLVRAASEDDSVADRVEELVAGLTSQIDDVFSRESLFVPADFMMGPGRGSVPLLALLKMRDAVDDFWEKRYYPADIRRATLAEIGRQVEVTHRVDGWVGLTDAKWIEILFRGGREPARAGQRLRGGRLPDRQRPGLGPSAGAARRQRRR